MPFDFKLPDLGEGIAEVELRRWLVREGDRVAEHQGLVEVETDKAVVEVPSPRAGLVARLHRGEGETVKVGETLVSIDEGDEHPQVVPIIQTAQATAPVHPVAPAPSAPSAQPPQSAQSPQPAQPAQPARPASVGIVGSLPEADEPALPAAGEFHGLATPMVRKLARERGIDLRSVRGSGPRGCISPQDLERVSTEARERGAAQRGEEPPSRTRAPEREILEPESFGPVERVPMRGLRRTIARNVKASLCTAASVTTTEEADITEIWELRNREQGEVESRGTHLTFLPFFIKAVQHALRDHPMLNASIDDATQTIVVKKHYHFGIAVATPEGLMVPVIRDVEQKSIIQLAQAIQELGRKAHDRSLAPEDLRGNSFTLTNYGHYGGIFATPVLNWPDVAILGFGRIVERPWVHRGEIAIRKILPMSLTFDHRVTDGADAAQFLTKVLRSLEDPALLFIEGS